MGVIAGLGLFVVTGAAVAGAVIWRKKRSGREGDGESEFSSPTDGFQAPGRGCPALLMGSTIHTHVFATLELIGNTLIKALVKMTERFFHLDNSGLGT